MDFYIFYLFVFSYKNPREAAFVIITNDIGNENNLTILKGLSYNPEKSLESNHFNP